MQHIKINRNFRKLGTNYGICNNELTLKCIHFVFSLNLEIKRAQNDVRNNEHYQNMDSTLHSKTCNLKINLTETYTEKKKCFATKNVRKKAGPNMG